MTDLTGLELREAESWLRDNDIEYTVKYTHPPRPMEETDSTRVLRQRVSGGAVELVVGLFKTKI